MLHSNLSKFTVLFTVFFFAISIMFGIAITKLTQTDRDLHTVLTNQSQNQSVNVAIAARDAAVAAQNAAEAAYHAALNADLAAKVDKQNLELKILQKQAVVANEKQNLELKLLQKGK